MNVLPAPFGLHDFHKPSHAAFNLGDWQWPTRTHASAKKMANPLQELASLASIGETGVIDIVQQRFNQVAGVGLAK